MTHNRFNYIVQDFNNATGNDEFPLALGSVGSRTEQLKQALIILGESIAEDGFGMQTRAALTHLGYSTAVNDENKFNEIILRAYKVGKKQMTLTEPEMRALYMQKVPLANRDKLTFEKWLNREGLKSKLTAGGKQVFDVFFGWLQLKAKGVGDVGGAPSAQPAPTSGGFFTSRDGEVPVGYYYIGGAVLLGFGIWVVSAIIKRNRNIVHTNLTSTI
jgi:hypothetical protein